FELIFANKGGAEVMFAEEIGDLKDKRPTRSAVHHVRSREQRVNPLFSGRIDAEKLQSLLDNVIRTETIDEWFLCGPFELAQLVRDELNSRKVDEQAVRYELFTTGKPTVSKQQTGRAVEADAEDSNVDVTLNADGLSGSMDSPVRWSLLNRRMKPCSMPPCVPARMFLLPAPAACAVPAAPSWLRAKWKWRRTSRWKRMKSTPVTSSPASLARRPPPSKWTLTRSFHRTSKGFQ